MSIQELGTIMESGAPVKIILLNNNYLGNVRQWQELFFNHRYSCTPMKNPDYMMIASAYGIPSRTVVNRDDLDDAISEMLTTPGPFLLQAAVEEEENVMPMTPPGADVDQMLPFTDPSTPFSESGNSFSSSPPLGASKFISSSEISGISNTRWLKYSSIPLISSYEIPLSITSLISFSTILTVILAIRSTDV